MLTCLIFEQVRAAGESGMVSETTTSSSGDSMMRWMAGPERTPWVAQATTRVAP